MDSCRIWDRRSPTAWLVPSIFLSYSPKCKMPDGRSEITHDNSGHRLTYERRQFAGERLREMKHDLHATWTSISRGDGAEL